MRKIGLSIFIILFLTSLVSSAIFINEVELDPSGSDVGNQWIELYNTGNSVNITGWFIRDSLGNNYTISGKIDQFFVLGNLTISNILQNISLFNSGEIIRDSTPILSDVSDDSNTYSRILDGSGSFVFQPSTKGLPNQPTLIQNKSFSDSCILENEPVQLNVQVSGFCTDEVIFSLFINGGWSNYSGTKEQGNNYSLIINSSILPSSDFVNFTVFVTDCFNTTSQDGILGFYVNSETQLLISSSNPDGLNNWYVTEPLFSLLNPDASNLFYQWDSDDILNYSSQFGLEDAPNNGIITAGVISLNYFSNLCNETKHKKILQIDLTNPLITSLNPQNGSTEHTSLRPEITAYIDEIYGTNSGINKSSFSMFLDSSQVSANIEDAPDEGLDAIVSFTPNFDLLQAEHNVTIFISDFSGRTSQLTWFFNINLTQEFNLTVYSPLNISYGSRSIPFNITTTKPVKLEYINYYDSRPTFKNLCISCRDYGFSTKRTKMLVEGQNNITIRATDSFGSTKEENISLFIDSKKPSILKISPKQNSYINGSFFFIKFKEENPASLIFIFNPETQINISSCEKADSSSIYNCTFSQDISIYNNSTIEFYFNISDSLNTVQSKRTKVFVDTTTPNLTINSPLIFNSTKYPINITISEPVLLQFKDSGGFRTLCNNCKDYGFKFKRTMTLSQGNHNILFKAIDKAGNSREENFTFTIE